jgi:hypothetical protein
MVVNVKKGIVGLAAGWKVWDEEVDRGRERYMDCGIFLGVVGRWSVQLVDCF